MTLCSFRVHNPDWGIRLYTSPIEDDKHWPSHEDQDQFSYQGEDWRDRLNDLGIEPIDYPSQGCAVSTADICRWDCLSRGEPFADMDIIFTRPFSEEVTRLLHTDSMAFDKGFAYIGFMGSGGGAVWKAILQEAVRQPKGTYQSAGVEAIYRLVYGHSDYGRIQHQDTLGLLNEKTGSSIQRIPMTWVYPLGVHEVFAHDFDYSTVQDIFGVHWFAGGNQAHISPTTSSPSNTVLRAARKAWEAYQGG